MRLGSSALYDPKNPDEPRTLAQRAIWEAVGDLVPKVHEELKEEVFPAYRDHYAGKDMPREWFGPLDPKHAGNEAERAMRKWAQRHHLAEPWLLELALLKIALWNSPQLENHDYDRRLRWSWAELAIVESSPSPVSRGYQPLLETWQEYKKRAQRALERHRQDTELQHKKTGYRRLPVKDSLHFELLVSYQVEGISLSKLAHRHHKARQTISEAVKSTAKLAGLTLRSPRSSSGRC